MPKLLVLVFLAAGCATVVPPPTPLPPPVEGATCATACQNAQSMHCPDVGPLCDQACENVVASGVFTYPVGCLTAARTCAQWDACQQ